MTAADGVNSSITTDRARAAVPDDLSMRLLAACLPLAIGVVLCVTWTRAERLVLGGDEPHYLVMARSVMLDGDFNLRNNYEEDAITGEIYGPVEPHAYQNRAGWPPYHAPGLGLLLAVPFRYAGLDGVRLTLLAVAALPAVAIFWWLRRWLTAGSSLMLGLALGLSVPFGYAAFRIYPDMPAAAVLIVVTLACARWWSGSAVPRGWPWCAAWLSASALPWLQSRFLAPWLVLVLGGVAIALRPALARARVRLLAGLALACVGLGLLLWFNSVHYGNLLGPPRWHELTRSPARALMIFLGLHLDQSQGLFMQQPLWLLGVIGLIPLARQQPWLFAWFVALYVATIVPPAMQMGRYGGQGTIGRYAWATAFLWVLPLQYYLTARGDEGGRVLRRWATAAVIVQSVLAARWIVSPEILGVNFDERVWARESLVPLELRYVFPSFYTWDFVSYWRYVPNVVAMLGVLLLAATGGVLYSETMRASMRRVWGGWLAAAALLLPAPPGADGSPEEQSRLDQAVRVAQSQSVRRFEAERLPPQSASGAPHEDVAASGGQVRVARGGDGASQAPAMFGPYVNVQAGRYDVVLALASRAAVHPETAVARLKITASRGRQALAERIITAGEITSASEYRRVRVPFETPAALDDVEFTVTLLLPIEVWIDYVEVHPLLP